MKKVTVIGSLNSDTTIHVDKFPLPGETIAAKSYDTALGGKGANQAAALAKAGLRVSMLGVTGQDQAGDRMIKELKSLGVSTEFVRQRKEEQTGQAFITVEASGNNHIIIIPGANDSFLIEYVMECKSELEETDAVLAQLEIPIDTVRMAFSFAGRKGIITVLNPAPAQNFTSDILEYTDILIPNECEIETISGRKITSDEDLAQACAWLEEQGVKIIIVTLGSRGCYLFHQGVGTFYAAYPVKAVDTTAAGDSFIGSFLAKYLETKDLAASVDFAQRVAAITVSRRGAIQSIPDKEEMERIKVYEPIQ